MDTLNGRLIQIQSGAQVTPSDLYRQPPVIPPGSAAAAVAPAQTAVTPNSTGNNPSWGKTIPTLFGASQSTGELIWTNQARSVSDDLNNLYAEIDFAVVFGQPGPRVGTANLRRIYFDGNPVYNASGDNQPVFDATFNFTFYDGSQTDPDPTILENEGDTTPAFQGRIYMVITDYQVPAGASATASFPVVTAELYMAEATTGGGGNTRPFKLDNPITYTNAIRWNAQSRALVVKNRFADDPAGQGLFDVFDTDTQSQIASIACTFPTSRDPTYADTFQLSLWDGAIWVTTTGSGSNSGGLACFDPGDGSRLSALDSGSYITHLGVVPGFTDVGGDFAFCGLEFTGLTICERPDGGAIAHRADVAMPGGFNQGPYAFASQEDWSDQPFDGSTFKVVYYVAANGLQLYRTILTPDEASGVLVGTGLVKSGSGYGVDRQYRGEQHDSLLTVTDGNIQNIWIGRGGKYVYLLINRNDGVAVVRRYATYYHFHNTAQARSPDLMTAADVATAGDFEVFAFVSEQELGSHTFTFNPAAQNIKPGTQTVVLAVAGALTNPIYEMNLATGIVKSHARGNWNELASFGSRGYGAQNWDGGMVYDYDNRCCFYSVFSDTSAGYNDWPGRVYFADAAPQDAPTYNVSDAFRDLSLLAGYDNSAIETTGIDDPINGMILNTPVRYKDLIGQLAGGFRVDILETPDLGIKFVRPARTSLITLPPTSIVPASTSGDDQHLVTVSRATADQLPQILQFQYIDLNYKYAVGSQIQRRVVYPAVVVGSKTVLVVSVPIVMSADDAAYWAGYALFDMWAGETTMLVTVPYKFLIYEPGDFVTLVFVDGKTFLCKIAAITINADFSQSWTLSKVVTKKPVPRRQITVQRTGLPYIEV